MNKIIFGPAGSPNRFKEAKFKSTLDLPQWVKDQGLDALEYACGRGIVMGEEFAGKFAIAAKDGDIKAVIDEENSQTLVMIMKAMIEREF